MNEYTRKILQALLDGETVQVLEAGKWEDADDVNHVLFEVLHQTNGLRVKPRTITLAGIEFPEPLRIEPKRGTEYWLIQLDYSSPLTFLWDGTVTERNWLRKGLLQATKEGAELQRKAMIKAVGGKL